MEDRAVCVADAFSVRNGSSKCEPRCEANATVVVPVAVKAAPGGLPNETAPKPVQDAASFFGVYDGERCCVGRAYMLKSVFASVCTGEDGTGQIGQKASESSWACNTRVRP